MGALVELFQATINVCKAEWRVICLREWNTIRRDAVRFGTAMIILGAAGFCIVASIGLGLGAVYLFLVHVAALNAIAAILLTGIVSFGLAIALYWIARTGVR